MLSVHQNCSYNIIYGACKLTSRNSFSLSLSPLPNRVRLCLLNITFPDCRFSFQPRQKVVSSCIKCDSSPLAGLPFSLVPPVWCKRPSPVSEPQLSLCDLISEYQGLRSYCVQQQSNQDVSRAGDCIRRGPRTFSPHPRYELRSETCQNKTNLERQEIVLPYGKLC